MADELKQSQLARIVVPAITDAEYSKSLADAFDKINDNFKKIASLPFLQGVQGDSYQLEEYPIWEKDKTENWILTEDGKILLDSIFGIDTTEGGDSFDNVRTCIGEELSGVSPIDFFKNGNDIVNNSLYFYVIKDDTDNIIEKQLGQYYYFVDCRLKEVGNIYNSENSGSVLGVFNDYTGFYQYKYDPENTNGQYIKVEILPTIYYDQNKNDICWKFNGNETGISAIGIKGADGKDADLSIVKVDLNNESGVYSSSPTSGKVVGILNTSANNSETTQWITDVTYFKTGKALIYMSGNIPIENPEENPINPLSGETETTETTINDFTYGEIVKQNDEYIAYWEPNCVFSKMLINNAFAKYFYNMGTVSYTNNAPYFLAIPSIQNRDSSTEEAKQHAHIIKGYDGNKDNNIESLNIFHSDNAFDEVGNQQINATESSGNKILNIKNYNVNISKALTVNGKILGRSGLQISGTAELGGNLTVAGTLGVTGIIGNVTFDNDLTVKGALGVTGAATFDNDLTVKGTLGVTGAGTFDSSLNVGGTTILNGTTVINNKLNVITNSFSNEAILTRGGATIQGDVHIKQNTAVTSTGALVVDKKITGKGGLEITKNGAIIYGGITVSGGASITGTAGIYGDLNVEGNEIASGYISTQKYVKTPVIYALGTGTSTGRHGIVFGVETTDEYEDDYNDHGNHNTCIYSQDGYDLRYYASSHELAGTTTITGAATITNTLTSNNKLTVGSGGAEINGTTLIKVNDNNKILCNTSGVKLSGTTTITGAATITNTLTSNNKLTVGSGGAEINGTTLIKVNDNNKILCDTSGVKLSGTTTINGATTINSILTVGAGSSLTVHKDITSTAGDIIATAGKVKASGGFFQQSDETLKDFHNDVQVDFEKLSLIPKKQFTWKSDEEKHMEIGTSAQEVLKLYPELVSGDENGILSVAYDKLSIVALKAIDELYKKNQELERRIKELESIILK